jgi:hypothetical protein
MVKNKEVADSFTKQLNKYFLPRKYFSCIYGSSASNEINIGSDVDLFISKRKFVSNDFKNIVGVVENIHSRYDLPIDQEVPFSNKLLITTVEMNNSVNMFGIEVRNNKFHIPDVVKSKEFLESDEIKFRLIFNALTTPHLYMGNDVNNYEKFKKIAEKNLIILACDMGNKLHLEKKHFLKIITENSEGSKGEMFLGYKESDTVMRYLSDLFNRAKNSFNNNCTRIGDNYIEFLNWDIIQKQKDKLENKSLVPINLQKNK